MGNTTGVLTQSKFSLYKGQEKSAGVKIGKVKAILFQ
jgi:hypothetical protein